ncbi:MAG TPA: chemotaxis protein CheX [Thermodesulfovibrionales bacterium]|nr:chemotaxis protein CheX [Thermodesulfovibrionales bacterium]
MILTEEQIDALKELINIGVGRASGVLSSMIECKISLQVPHIRVLSLIELNDEVERIGAGRLAAVKLGFKGSFAGTAALVFPPDSAAKLVSLLVREENDTPDLDSVRVGTLNEVGNIVINGVMGSVANVLKQHIDYSLPTYVEDSLEHMLTAGVAGNEIMILLAHTHFTVEEYMIEGNIILLFESKSFGSLILAIDRDLRR